MATKMMSLSMTVSQQISMSRFVECKERTVSSPKGFLNNPCNGDNEDDDITKLR